MEKQDAGGVKMVVNGIDAEDVLVDMMVKGQCRNSYCVGDVTGERNSQTREDKALLTASPAAFCLQGCVASTRRVRKYRDTKLLWYQG